MHDHAVNFCVPGYLVTLPERDGQQHGVTVLPQQGLCRFFQVSQRAGLPSAAPASDQPPRTTHFPTKSGVSHMAGRDLVLACGRGASSIFSPSVRPASHTRTAPQRLENNRITSLTTDGRSQFA